MKLSIQQLRRLRTWPFVYALLILMVVSRSPDAAAEDEREIPPESLPDTAAELALEESRWLYTKSVRLELLERDGVRVETTIPLHHHEKPKLKLAMTSEVARNWSVNLSIWTSL